MKEKLYCLLSIFAVAFAVAILVVGCPRIGSLYYDDLGNGYVVVASDVIEETFIIIKDKGSYGGSGVVPSMVFAYGWNDDFILAKQHPLKSHRKVDTNLTYWYIVEVASGNVHGPLSEDEFNKLRTKLKVPAEISFKTIQ